MTKFVQNNNDLNIDYHTKKRGIGPSKKGLRNPLNSSSKKQRDRADILMNEPSSKSVYKTVILPNSSRAENGQTNQTDLDESTNNHLKLIANLAADLNHPQTSIDPNLEEYRVLVQHVNSLRDELAKREREASSNAQDLQTKLREVMEKNRKLERVGIELNKEFFAQRVKFEQIERKLQQENELLRLKNVSLANQLADTQQSAELENRITKDLLEKRSLEYANNFKQKCRVKEERLNQFQDQYKEIKAVYAEKVGSLELNLKSLKSK